MSGQPRSRVGLLLTSAILAAAVALAACVTNPQVSPEHAFQRSRVMYHRVASWGAAGRCLLSVPRDTTLGCARIVEVDRLAVLMILRGDRIVDARTGPDRAQALYDLAAFLDTFAHQLAAFGP